MLPRTNVYIDGFNLYYGCIRRTNFHWLDLVKLCRLLLPDHQIGQIWYFTAMVSNRPDDPLKPQRQQAYLRALRTFPEMRIELGQFVQHNRILPLVKPLITADGELTRARVVRTDEKGSDVNLATRLLHEAHLDLFDVGVVISNDSDLLAPIKLVRGEIGKRIGIVNPHQRPSKELLLNADFVKQIRQGVLQLCRLPVSLTDAKGEIRCPEQWRPVDPEQEVTDGNTH